MGWFGFVLLTFTCLFCFNLNIEARNVAVNRAVQHPHGITEIGLSGEEPSPKAADTAEIYPAPDSRTASPAEINPTSKSTAAEARNVAVNRAVQNPHGKTEIGLRGEEPAPKAADTAEIYPAPDSKAAGTAKIKPDNTSIPVSAQENLATAPK